MKHHAGRSIAFALAVLGCSPPASDDARTATPPMATRARRVSLRASLRNEGVTLRVGDVERPITFVTSGLGAVGASRRGSDGEVVLVHARSVEERWTPHADGAAQSWCFAEAPPDGRVSIEVAVESARFDHGGSDGLWLRDPRGALLRYGHATWVDADGTRTAVPARWTGERIALDVPGEVVARSRFPAVLDPIVTLSFALEAPITGTSHPSDFAEAPLIVPTPTGALAFSIDEFPSRTQRIIAVEQRDAFGATVPGSRRVLPETYGTDGPFGVRAAAYADGVWLAWNHCETDLALGCGVRAQRVDFAGRPIDRSASTLYPSNPVARANSVLDVTCGADTCLAIFPADRRSLFAVRVASDGRVLDGAPILLDSDYGGSTDVTPRAAAVTVGDQFIAVWGGRSTDGPAVRAARVTLDGRTLDPGGRVLQAAPGWNLMVPSIATNGSDLLVAWEGTTRWGLGGTLVGAALLHADLELATTLTIPRWTELDAQVMTFHLDRGWVLAVREHLASYDDGGAMSAVTTSDPEVSSAFMEWLHARGSDLWALAPCGSDPTCRGSPIGVMRFGADGVVRGPLSPLEPAILDQLNPRVGSDGRDFVVSWRVGDDLDRFVDGVRLDGDGVMRERFRTPAAPWWHTRVPLLSGDRVEVFGSGASIAVDLTTGDVSRERSWSASTEPMEVVRGASGALVLQVDRADPWAAFGPGHGWSLDASGTAVGDPIAFDRVISLNGDFDGSAYAVIGPTYASGALASFWRVRADGSTDSPPHDLSALGQMRQGARLAFGGGAHLVGWNDPYGLLRMARLDLDGSLIDAPWTFSTSGRLAEIVFDGTNFLVLWTGENGESPRLTRLSTTGVPLDRGALAMTEDPDLDTTVAADVAMATDGHGTTLVTFPVVNRESGALEVRARLFREGATPLDGGRGLDDVRLLDDEALDLGDRPATPPDATVTDTPDALALVDAADARDAGSPTIDVLPDDVASGDAGMIDVGGRTDATSLDARRASDRPPTPDTSAAEDIFFTDDAPALGDGSARAVERVGGCGVRSQTQPPSSLAVVCISALALRRRRRASKGGQETATRFSGRTPRPSTHAPRTQLAPQAPHLAESGHTRAVDGRLTSDAAGNPGTAPRRTA